MRVMRVGGGGVSMSPADGFDDRFASMFAVAVRPAFRILRSVPAAEDVAAEVLARVLVDWDRLGAAPWLDAWLVRVATNLSIDAVRREQRSAPVVAVAESGDLELRLDLSAAVARLPRRQREAVSLRFFGDLPEAEVAALLGVSVGTAKKHISRGLGALRRRMVKDWQGEFAWG